MPTLLAPTISKAPSAEPGLDQPRLFALGLEHVRRLARRLWTDHNLHDPGITILELLSYALTDVSYRASFPIEDLLASSADPVENAERMARQFFTARQILPNRALTLLDYRKLLIDLKGVRNAWVLPAELTYFADPVAGALSHQKPNRLGIREVEIRGLYRVLLDYMDGIEKPEQRDEINAAARRLLQQNRNLCEDFVEVGGVETQDFLLCAELELAPDADTARVHAEILFQVDRSLNPPVRNYRLSEMLERGRTVEEIFDGPLLAHGFLDDEELERAELPTVIRLSDVISVIMDIEGVRAVRDIVINPRGTAAPLADKWQVAVAPGRRPTLSREGSRLVLYKRQMPVTARAESVDEHLARLAAEERSKLEEEIADDLPIPLGRYRNPERYTSFQNDFPALYGLGEAGLPAGADTLDAKKRRRALAWQLKAYLLFFDQVMANSCAQLSGLRDLFSTDPDLAQTYFTQVVRTFVGSAEIYRDGLTTADLAAITEDGAMRDERRNRFLDHLVARYAERFHDYVAIMRSAFGADAASVVQVKCDFLKDYPALGAERGLAHDAGAEPETFWNSTNISGLERRIGRLLGIADLSRRDLSGGAGPEGEGMILIESILLRPVTEADPFLPICVDPNCTDCADDDPYSYRLHIVLPAFAGRFANMDFRRFAEEVIREETPAHILPRICWIGQDDMARLEVAYRAWLKEPEKIEDLIQTLFSVKNVYPVNKLRGCDDPEDQPKFILGRTALGTAKSEEPA